MSAILSLLAHATLAVVAFFVAIGSVFTGGHLAVTAQPNVVATTKTSFPTAAPATTTAKVSSQKSSGLLSGAKPAAPAGQTFVQTPSPSFPPAVPASPTEPTLSVEQVNALARGSLVNILCTTAGGGSFNPISGSGVIIDNRGVILTNAHVAQYFLLRDYPTKGNIECVVRVGSPAQPLYTAELLYLPKAWVDANAAKISSSTPTGTGEDDFAFLRITGTTDPNGTLPASFLALPMTGADPDTGSPMVLAAYPAGFLGGISITLSLYQTSAVASVGQLYDFADSSHVDLFSLGGTVVSQAGSSGGAAVNLQGKLQGLISNEVTADTTAGRDLRAITMGYIDRELADQGQGGILGLLSGDPSQTAATFKATIAPKETAELESVLK